MKVSQLPLIATLFRIAIVPVIVVLMIYRPSGWPLWCWFLFVLASLTDWLDGYLARKLQSVTVIGQFLDPIADKVLVSSVLILFIPLEIFDALGVLLLINRDVLIGGVRSIAASQGQVIAAGSLGKWKTAFQMVCIPSLFLAQSWDFLPFWEVGYYGLWCSVVLSLVSGAQYFVGFLKAQS